MEKNRIDVSVIVPIYNVEEYLKECLASLLRQGNVSLEVIMIDDGSTDGSGAIAKQFEEEYENFHYHLIENGGLGHARNYAIQFAAGKYITFVDSDDMIVDETYEKMFMMAEKNGSELTICNVARFNSETTWGSTLHQRVFYNLDHITNIKKNPSLIYDTTSWNKMILRSFYLENDFKFAENILYEDIPVTIPMHTMASHVSVFSDVGYLWRVRDGASKSITQNTGNMNNLRDRLTVLKMLDKFFQEHVQDPELYEMMQKKTLEVDLMIFINVCKSVPIDQAEEIMAIIKAYIEEYVDESVFESLSVLNRQKYEYLMKGELEGLIKTCEFGISKYHSVPIKEENGELYADLPEDIFTIKERNVTRELVDYEPRKYIDDITVSDGKIEIYAHVYTRRINMSENRDQKVAAFLYNELSDVRIPLQVVPRSAKELTDSMGTMTDSERGIQTTYNYDGTGCIIIIDLDKIKDCTENYGWNKIVLEYENRFSAGKVILGGCSGATKSAYHTSTLMIDDYIARVFFTYMNELQIFVNHETVFGEKILLDEGRVICRISAAVEALWAVASDEKETVMFETKDEKEFSAPIKLFHEKEKYSIFIKTQEGKRGLLKRSKNINIQYGEGKAIIINSLRTFIYSFCLYDHITILKKSESEDQIVRFWTKTIGNAEALASAVSVRLCVKDDISGNMVVLAKSSCRWKSNAVSCSFTIDFGKERIKRNFYQSIRDIFIEYRLEDGSEVRDTIFSNRHFRYQISEETLDLRCYRGMDGTARLRIRQLWGEEEDSLQKREALTFKNYPLYRKEKINPKQIVFESMWGTKYSCNPQALYEYIDKYYPEYECIWFLEDARTPIKGRGKRVRRGSQEYYHYLATAKYFVNNVNFATDYVKRKGQIEIQTMHGTPLKTLGLDVVSDFPTESSRQQYIEKNSRWNYLIVQGEFMAQKGKSIFEFEKEVLRTGYPRTDRLFGFDQKAADKVKESLGLPNNKKIILYAPTWRIKGRFDMNLDLEKMKKFFSDEYILLIRLHHFSASGYTIPEDNEFIFDFNSYRYVEELYMIADILITDYSSVMFDFALLKKPMLFFTYDLEEYGDKLRGLYIDFAKEAPGPLLFHSDEVIQAILHLDEKMEKCKDRVENFHKKFLTYERPNSSELVVKRVLRPNPVTHMSYKVKKKIAKARKKLKH